eukprot:scaffold124113_cov63-Phaeocystis_antarctica.AAC.8
MPPRGLLLGGTGDSPGAAGSEKGCASRVGKAESRGVRGGEVRCLASPSGEVRAGGEVRGVREARRPSSSSRARACGCSTRKRRPSSSSLAERPGKAGNGAAAAAAATASAAAAAAAADAATFAASAAAIPAASASSTAAATTTSSAGSVASATCLNATRGGMASAAAAGCRSITAGYSTICDCRTLPRLPGGCGFAAPVVHTADGASAARPRRTTCWFVGWSSQLLVKRGQPGLELVEGRDEWSHGFLHHVGVAMDLLRVATDEHLQLRVLRRCRRRRARRSHLLLLLSKRIAKRRHLVLQRLKLGTAWRRRLCHGASCLAPTATSTNRQIACSSSSLSSSDSPGIASHLAILLAAAGAAAWPPAPGVASAPSASRARLSPSATDESTCLGLGVRVSIRVSAKSTCPILALPSSATSPRETLGSAVDSAAVIGGGGGHRPQSLIEMGSARHPRPPAPHRLRPRSKTKWLSLRPAGAPEASLGARACLRLPQAPASLGQAAPWAALTRHIGRGLNIARHQPSEDHVTSAQVLARRESDVELAAVGVGARVSHAEQAAPVLPHAEPSALVRKGSSEDRPLVGSALELTALQCLAGQQSMEHRATVAHGTRAGGKPQEVGDGLRCGRSIQRAAASCSRSAAAPKGSSPLASLTLAAAAPCSKSSVTSAARSLAAALCSAVLPPWFTACTSVPARESSHVAISRWPPAAAQCSAEWPDEELPRSRHAASSAGASLAAISACMAGRSPERPAASHCFVSSRSAIFFGLRERVVCCAARGVRRCGERGASACGGCARALPRQANNEVCEQVAC